MAQVKKEFSEQHIAAFLDKIAADRNRQVRELEESIRLESADIRREAYRRARQFQHEHAREARDGQRQARERQLSRARAGLRRHRWHLLQELLAEALWAAGQALQRRWSQRDEQRRWCEHWLDLALENCGGAPLIVTVGEGGLAQTRTALEKRVQHLDGCRVRLVPEEAAGIVIGWGDRILDGRLESQFERLETLLFAELTAWLHEQETDQAPKHD